MVFLRSLSKLQLGRMNKLACFQKDIYHQKVNLQWTTKNDLAYNCCTNLSSTFLTLNRLVKLIREMLLNTLNRYQCYNLDQGGGFY